MSMGYYGSAELVYSDNDVIVYAYGCYNINNNNYKLYMHAKDGVLTIQRDALIEAEIRRKIKRTASGRKKEIVKRIHRDVPFDELLEKGKIEIENASGTWVTSEEGYDVIARRVLYKIFERYQETGTIPEHVVWFC